MAASVLDERYVPADAPVDAALPTTASAAPGGGAIVPVSGVSWVPYAADRPFHGQVMQMDASPVPLDPGVTVRPGQVVGLGWFCKKELSPDNRVRFDDDAADEHGLPAIRIDYALSAADEAAIEAAKVEIAEAARALGRPLGDPFVMPPGSSLHYLGTTRMGTADDGTSVCDPTGRVWGTAEPLRRRQQRHPDRHRLQPDPDRRRARRAHRPHASPTRWPPPSTRRHPHEPPSPDRRQRPDRAPPTPGSCWSRLAGRRAC